VVLEGELVNTAVTGPGATLALALMFLRTNDAAVAASFTLPTTAHTLDTVRLVCHLTSELGADRTQFIWAAVTCPMLSVPAVT